MTKKMVWIDIETTGLEPKDCKIMEIACVITDESLNVLSRMNLLVYNTQYTLSKMNDWCQTQHGKSGLIKEVLKLNKMAHNIQWVEHQLLEFLKYNGIEKGKNPMCGNSIHFDRAFLKEHTPELESYFHYHNVDITTIGELIKMWYSDEMTYKKNKNHRAMDDIDESLKEAGYYKYILSILFSKSRHLVNLDNKENHI